MVGFDGQSLLVADGLPCLSGLSILTILMQTDPRLEPAPLMPDCIFESQEIRSIPSLFSVPGHA